MKYSIVIPAFNQLNITNNCLKQLALTYGPSFEIVLVDDGSTEDLGRLAKLHKVKYVRLDTNQGFAAACNAGIGAATGEHIILLNNDVFASPQWLTELDEQVVRRKLDLAAPRGGRIDRNGDYKGEVDKEPFDYLVGWCLFIKRSVFERIGLIPTEFGRGFFEDTLFSLRAKRAGFKLGIIDLHMVHIGHHTFKAEKVNIAELYKKNRELFKVLRNKENKK